MRPGSLLSACGWRATRTLVKAFGQLDITNEEERVRFVDILSWFIENYGDFLFLSAVQDHLHKNLITALRCRRNPPLCIAAMLVLCPKVVIDEIPLVQNVGEDLFPKSGMGLQITAAQCKAIMRVVVSVQERRATLKRLGLIRDGPAALPTTSLLLEEVYFWSPKFFPHLFWRMANLRHIELKFNGTLKAMNALRKSCKYIESISYLDTFLGNTIPERDVLPALFGTPRPNRGGFPPNFLDRFLEEEDFRVQFAPRFPNLKRLNLDGLNYGKEELIDVYALAMILQPKLVSFGKYTGLTLRILKKYKLWSALNGGQDCRLNLTKARFIGGWSEEWFSAREDLASLVEARPMFPSLRSVELQKEAWDGELVGRFCQAYGEQVDALSLSDLRSWEASSFAGLAHLRLSHFQQVSFEQVHLILDVCSQLLTLSIHSMCCDVLRGEHEGARLGEGLRPLEARTGFCRRASAQRRKVHPKLTTLRINSLMKATKESSKAFLSSLLERLPNLRSLCMGTWLASLSRMRSNLTCVGGALVSVVNERRGGQPFMPQLEQLCCLPHGTENEMCSFLAQLAEAFPELHTLAIPTLERRLMKPILNYFMHSSIDIRQKCASDQVFAHWESGH